MSIEKTDGFAKDVCVCILAHNEQKHIARTIHTIQAGNHEIEFDLKVYANGCTDETVTIVKKLCITYPNLQLRELEKASKPLAWNAAFQENDKSILIFSDGDVEPEPDSVFALCNSFKQNDAVILASCQYWPQKSGLSFGQKVTGFLQIPLAQDFLTGCFYAVRKRGLKKEFEKKSISGIPAGIVGEDFFLEHLVPEHNFIVIEKKCFYEPPTLEDYWKYIARIQWQEEQIALFFPPTGNSSVVKQKGVFDVLKRKMLYYQGTMRLSLGIFSSIMRFIIVFLFKKNINRYYRSIGPVIRQGGAVLSYTTRSTSAK